MGCWVWLLVVAASQGTRIDGGYCWGKLGKGGESWGVWVKDQVKLCHRNFHWLEPEVRRYTLKCEAKQKARLRGASSGYADNVTHTVNTDAVKSLCEYKHVNTCLALCCILCVLLRVSIYFLF